MTTTDDDDWIPFRSFDPSWVALSSFDPSLFTNEQVQFLAPKCRVTERRAKDWIQHWMQQEWTLQKTFEPNNRLRGQEFMPSYWWDHWYQFWHTHHRKWKQVTYRQWQREVLQRWPTSVQQSLRSLTMALANQTRWDRNPNDEYDPERGWWTYGVFLSHKKWNAKVHIPVWRMPNDMMDVLDLQLHHESYSSLIRIHVRSPSVTWIPIAGRKSGVELWTYWTLPPWFTYSYDAQQHVLSCGEWTETQLVPYGPPPDLYFLSPNKIVRPKPSVEQLVEQCHGEDSCLYEHLPPFPSAEMTWLSGVQIDINDRRLSIRWTELKKLTIVDDDDPLPFQLRVLSSTQIRHFKKQKTKAPVVLVMISKGIRGVYRKSFLDETWIEIPLSKSYVRLVRQRVPHDWAALWSPRPVLLFELKTEAPRPLRSLRLSTLLARLQTMKVVRHPYEEFDGVWTGGSTSRDEEEIRYWIIWKLAEHHYLWFPNVQGMYRSNESICQMDEKEQLDSIIILDKHFDKTNVKPKRRAFWKFQDYNEKVGHDVLNVHDWDALLYQSRRLYYSRTEKENAPTMISVGVVVVYPDVAHANRIFIDLKNHEISLYDPHGSYGSELLDRSVVESLVLPSLRQWSGQSRWTIVDTKALHYQTSSGFQQLEEIKGTGYCECWCNWLSRCIDMNTRPSSGTTVGTWTAQSLVYALLYYLQSAWSDRLTQYIEQAISWMHAQDEKEQLRYTDFVASQTHLKWL